VELWGGGLSAETPWGPLTRPSVASYFLDLLVPMLVHFEACLGLVDKSRGSPSSFMVWIWFYRVQVHPVVSFNPLRLSSWDIIFFFDFQESAGGWYDCDQSVEVWGGGLGVEIPWGPSQGQR
jgi:hypothetical protein